MPSEIYKITIGLGLQCIIEFVLLTHLDYRAKFIKKYWLPENIYVKKKLTITKPLSVWDISVFLNLIFVAAVDNKKYNDNIIWYLGHPAPK